MISQDDKFNVYNASGYTNFVVDVVGTFNLYPPTPPAGWNSNLTSAAPQPGLQAGSRGSATPEVSTVHMVKRI